jgi:hypothetical protein
MATATTDWHPGRRTSAALQVHLLGPTELDAAVALQERIADELTSRSDRHGVLLLCEHPQGITFGRDSSVTDLLVERDELEARDVPLRWQRRGGGTWAHHPGQLVAYLIVPVTRLGFTIPGYVERLTAAFHHVGEEQRVWPDPLPEAPGLHGRCGTMVRRRGGLGRDLAVRGLSERIGAAARAADRLVGPRGPTDESGGGADAADHHGGGAGMLGPPPCRRIGLRALSFMDGASRPETHLATDVCLQ